MKEGSFQYEMPCSAHLNSWHRAYWPLTHWCNHWARGSESASRCAADTCRPSASCLIKRTVARASGPILRSPSRIQ